MVNLPPSEDVASLPGSPHDVSESNAVSVNDGSDEPRRANHIAQHFFQRKKIGSVGQWGSGAEGQSECVQAWGMAVHRNTGHSSG